jgi:hypothetical protein
MCGRNRYVLCCAVLLCGQVLALREPTLLRGAPSELWAAQNWTLASLRAALGSGPISRAIVSRRARLPYYNKAFPMFNEPPLPTHRWRTPYAGASQRTALFSARCDCSPIQGGSVVWCGGCGCGWVSWCSPRGGGCAWMWSVGVVPANSSPWPWRSEKPEHRRVLSARVREQRHPPLGRQERIWRVGVLQPRNLRPGRAGGPEIAGRPHTALRPATTAAAAAAGPGYAISGSPSPLR